METITATPASNTKTITPVLKQSDHIESLASRAHEIYCLLSVVAASVGQDHMKEELSMTLQVASDLCKRLENDIVAASRDLDMMSVEKRLAQTESEKAG